MQIMLRFVAAIALVVSLGTSCRSRETNSDTKDIVAGGYLLWAQDQVQGNSIITNYVMLGKCEGDIPVPKRCPMIHKRETESFKAALMRAPDSKLEGLKSRIESRQRDVRAEDAEIARLNKERIEAYKSSEVMSPALRAKAESIRAEIAKLQETQEKMMADVHYLKKIVDSAEAILKTNPNDQDALAVQELYKPRLKEESNNLTNLNLEIGAKDNALVNTLAEVMNQSNAVKNTTEAQDIYERTTLAKKLENDSLVVTLRKEQLQAMEEGKLMRTGLWLKISRTNLPVDESKLSGLEKEIVTYMIKYMQAQ